MWSACFSPGVRYRLLKRKVRCQSPVADFLSGVDHTVLADLTPERAADPPNCRRSRAVMNGHYVQILPEALPEPDLVAISDAMSVDLGLDPAAMRSQEMLKVLAGDLADLPLKPWATPYGTSVNGSLGLVDWFYYTVLFNQDIDYFFQRF